MIFETLEDLTTRVNSETKDTVAHVIQFHLFKWPKQDLSLSMESNHLHFHLNIWWPAIIWTKDVMVVGHILMCF